MKFPLILIISALSFLNFSQVLAENDNKPSIDKFDLLHLNATQLMEKAIYKAKLGYGEDVNYKLHVVMHGASEEQIQVSVTSAFSLKNSKFRSTQFYLGIDDDGYPITN